MVWAVRVEPVDLANADRLVEVGVGVGVGVRVSLGSGTGVEVSTGTGVGVSVEAGVEEPGAGVAPESAAKTGAETPSCTSVEIASTKPIDAPVRFDRPNHFMMLPQHRIQPALLLDTIASR
jgi:hypothetical protein